MDGENGQFTAKLNSGVEHTIREFRTHECWNIETADTWSADIALMIFEEPIEDAVEGKDYIHVWDAEEIGNVANRQFIIAGQGASGEVKKYDMVEDPYEREFFLLFRGDNFVNEIRKNNLLVYTMDTLERWSEPEPKGHYGDSGTGALIRSGDELYIAGVKSHGENGHFDFSYAYTRASGELTRSWIEANFASLDERVPVESCEAQEEYETTFAPHANT